MYESIVALILSEIVEGLETLNTNILIFLTMNLSVNWIFHMIICKKQEEKERYTAVIYKYINNFSLENLEFQSIIKTEIQ